MIGRRLHKFWGLKGDDKFLLIRAFLLLVIVRLVLWILPLRIIQEMLDKITGVADTKSYQFTPERIAWAVTAASMYIPKATCLSKALTAHALLAEFGYSPDLMIGVAKGEFGQLEAHAWVENAGKVVIGGSNHDHYTKLSPLKRDGQ